MWLVMGALARNTVSCSSMAALRHSSRDFPALKLEKRSAMVLSLSSLDGRSLKKFSQLLLRIDDILMKRDDYTVVIK